MTRVPDAPRSFASHAPASRSSWPGSAVVSPSIATTRSSSWMPGDVGRRARHDLVDDRVRRHARARVVDLAGRQRDADAAELALGVLAQVLVAARRQERRVRIEVVEHAARGVVDAASSRRPDRRSSSRPCDSACANASSVLKRATSAAARRTRRSRSRPRLRRRTRRRARRATRRGCLALRRRLREHGSGSIGRPPGRAVTRTSK